MHSVDPVSQASGAREFLVNSALQNSHKRVVNALSIEGMVRIGNSRARKFVECDAVGRKKIKITELRDERNGSDERARIVL